MISQRIAKISLILNVVLTLACFGLLIYALAQQTVAHRNEVEANMYRQKAIEQMELAEEAYQAAETAKMEAILRYELAKKKSDSLKLINQTKPK